MNSQRILFRAALVADGEKVWAAPGEVLVEGERIVAAGRPGEIGPVGGDVRVVTRPRAAIIPALVNVHCHLDLTHIGPIEFPGDFPEWVNIVRTRRATTEQAVAASVRLGVDLARRGGTGLIGDIAGMSSLTPTQTLRASGLGGVSFFEVFGLGRHQMQAIERMREAVEACPAVESGVVHGLQPHAPYSCGLEVYRAALALERPNSTHLAETADEIEFLRQGTGRIRDMLVQIRVLDDMVQPSGLHPVEHVASVLGERAVLAAHLNYIEDRHLEVMARSGICVAYCPRASAYFGHAGHRYQEMIQHGLNVALGTDSIMCLDTPGRISIFDEMRLLHRRDGTDPRTLLRMATVNGARALGFDETLLTLLPGKTAGLLAVEPPTVSTPGDALRAALLNDGPPEWLLGPAPARNEWKVE